MVYRDENSTAIPTPWLYDIEVDQECIFLETGTEEGERVFHCLGGISGDLFFSDAACTQPIAAIAHCKEAEPGQLVHMVESSGPCGPPKHLYYELGEAVLADSVYSPSFDGCTPRSTTTVPALDFLTVEPLDLTQFVRGTARRVPLGGLDDFHVVVVDGEDGSIGLSSFTSFGSTCRLRTVDPGEFVCEPEDLGLLGYFQGDACEIPLVQGPRPYPECPFTPPRVTSMEERLECTTQRRYFEVGDEFTSGVVSAFSYPNDPDSCRQVETSTPLFELGRELLPEELPVLREERVGEGRLTSLTRTDAEGKLSWPTASIFDTEFERPCLPTRTIDGDLRCIPRPYYYDIPTTFTDPECTQVARPILTGPCYRSPALRLWTRMDEPCYDLVVSVHEQAEYEGPLFERLGETCEPVRPDIAARDTYIANVREIPLSEFATLELVVE